MTTERKYSTGDRVKVTSGCLTSGKIGTVTGYCNCYNNAVVVHLDCGYSRNYNELSLTLIEKYKGEQIMALTGNFKIATVNFIQGYNTNRKYGFALFDDEIKEGDIVLCDSDNGYNIAKVVGIMTQEEYGKSVTKEIVCKCDFAPFEKRKAIRKQKVEIKKKLDKAVKENQNLILYKTIAQNNPDVAALLAEYEALTSEECE